MTFCSTIASLCIHFNKKQFFIYPTLKLIIFLLLVMLPAWLYTLGTLFSTKANIEIPFHSLMLNLLATVVPCIIGLLISIFVPNSKKFAERHSKPVILVSIIVFFSIVITSKFFIFKLITFENSLTVLIPWCGFILSAFTAFLFRFPKSQILTICFETGYQNLGVAFIIITYNFPSPESDLAIAPLISLSFLTPVPFYIALIVRYISKCFKKNKKNDKKEIDEDLKKEFKEESVEMIEKKTELEI